MLLAVVTAASWPPIPFWQAVEKCPDCQEGNQPAGTEAVTMYWQALWHNGPGRSDT